MSVRARLVALLLAAALLAGGATDAVAASPSPPGANGACRPTAAHPYPVVLVHGTFGNMFDSFLVLSPALKRAGYCVYAFNYGSYRGSGVLGVYGVGPIERSAAQLKAEVDKVLAATGARRVELVGHSQGGMMPRYYMKHLGGGSKVEDLVGLAPSNHGTRNVLASPSAPLCPACAQQAAGSAFITALNRGDETPGGADFTNIVTRRDEVVRPYTSGYLAADGNRVTNVAVQSRCPGDLTEHVAMPYDRVAIALTLNALGRDGPANPRYRPAC